MCLSTAEMNSKNNIPWGFYYKNDREKLKTNGLNFQIAYVICEYDLALIQKKKASKYLLYPYTRNRSLKTEKRRSY